MFDPMNMPGAEEDLSNYSSTDPVLTQHKLTDEEIAFRLVELYVRHISQRGEKRQMGLDTIINAYVYTLGRLENKRQEINLMEEAVQKEEKILEHDIEQIKFPEKDQLDFLGG